MISTINPKFNFKVENNFYHKKSVKSINNFVIKYLQINIKNLCNLHHLNHIINISIFFLCFKVDTSIYGYIIINFEIFFQSIFS
jgi:hypothetical protein